MTDRDTARVEKLERAWAARVRANREQVDRVREVADGADFYGPVSSLFMADPRRTGDQLLESVLAHARPHDTWLDIGAGAGRFALPLALRVREVIALDPSRSMLDELRAAMVEHGVANVRVVEGRWPEVAAAPDAPLLADVAFIAHVGYDVEQIGPFLDAMEAAARRSCLAVLMERPPATLANPFWPVVHGEERIPLPALGDFLGLLAARGHEPRVEIVEQRRRRFTGRAEVHRFLLHQLWVDPDGAKGRRLAAEMAARIVEHPDGLELRHDETSRLGVVCWTAAPPR